MISAEYFFEKLKDVKFSDILAIIPMVIARLISPWYRERYKDYWLICEEPYEARDNGFYFYEYLRKKQKQQKCIYAIKYDSPDYIRVKDLGETVVFGSIKHWIIYFTCQYNISSQKGGKPNAALCSFAELNGVFTPRNIFLQHGITINLVSWLFATRSNIERFITATVDEDTFIKEKFGYSEEQVNLTGFPRFDGLHDRQEMKHRILIMPTWRYWFNLNSKKVDGEAGNFADSEYAIKWKELLCSEALKRLVDRYQLEVIFYPHRNMQQYLIAFSDVPEHITIASWEMYDIRELLKSSKLMITDYSSVFFDMVYMKKPVIFYQFDSSKYRLYQYKEGYFDYTRNPFGQSFTDVEAVVKALEEYVCNSYQVSEPYHKEHNRIFKFYDKKNSERIFSILKKAEF